MDVVHRLNDITFVWDSKKALVNLQKHGVALEMACEIFFDPFVCLLRTDALGGEDRELVVGMTRGWQLLMLSTPSARTASASSPPDVPPHQREGPMKMDQLRERLRKDRPMTTISLRMPEDVVEELKRIAPLLGFSGYQPLIRTYVGQGLRQDVERLSQQPGIERIIESLRRQGVAEEVISSVAAELRSA
jgi:uncharacterized DUF497 family protein